MRDLEKELLRLFRGHVGGVFLSCWSKRELAHLSNGGPDELDTAVEIRMLQLRYPTNMVGGSGVEARVYA
jgi:hypothetical protein